MKVAVTGASGFLGAWLIKALVKEGHEVAAVVRSTSDLSFLREVAGDSGWRPIVADVTRADEMASVFIGQEAVFHLAAAMGMRRSDAERLFQVNVEGTRNVVRACAEAGVKRLVHVSSVVAVGASEEPGMVLNEDSKNPFVSEKLKNFEAKRLAEEIVKDACSRGAVDAVIVNPSLVYGAGDARKEARSGSVQAARGKVKAYPIGGVSVVGVEDVVSGMIAAWKKGSKGERYILSGENMSLRDMLFMICDCAGVARPRRALPTGLLKFAGAIGEALKLNGPLNRENMRVATLYHWYDHSKATRELGFNPGPARMAIEQSVQWMKGHGYA